MITTDYCTLVGAYGRDYRSAQDAEREFLAGKDFMLLPSHQYLSIRDFCYGVKVNLTFANRTRIHCVVVPEVKQPARR